MNDQVATYIQFDGGVRLPLEYISPISLKQTRGLDPYMFSVSATRIDDVPAPSGGDGTKCSFVFEVGDTTKEWKGWYLVRIEPSRTLPDLWTMVFGDERWRVQYRRFTMAYNVQWPDGSYREGTSPFPDGWEARSAIVDAFSRMGYELDVTDVPVETANKLPNNLGNSPAGGWVQATFGEIVGPMLDAIKCDLILRTNGKFAAVTRYGLDDTPITELRSYSRIIDTVGESKNLWERPKRVAVAFEIKAEAALESKLSRTTSGAVPIFDVPENVMPRFEAKLRDPEAWWDNAITPAATDWETIGGELYNAGYLPGVNGRAFGDPNYVPMNADLFIGRNYFLPQIIPFEREYWRGKITDTIDVIEKKEWFDATIRNHWRRTYRLVFPTSRNPSPSVKDERRMAGIRLGRLTPGGETYSKGSVFCDWCEETTDEVGPSWNPLEAVFSVNHPISNDPSRPSPFVARWVDQSGGEVILQMVPMDATRIGQAVILPGLLTEPLTWRSYLLAIQGLESRDETRGEFGPDFDFRIIMAGRLIGDDERIKSNLDAGTVEIKGRYAVIDTPTWFAASAGIDTMEFRSNVVTANFGYTKAQLELPIGELADKFPAKLLNLKELQNIHDKVKANVERDFLLGFAGGIRAANIEAMGEVETGGDVYEFSVSVGDPDPWCIVAQWVFAPGALAWSVDPAQKDGRTPAAIEQE